MSKLRKHLPLILLIIVSLSALVCLNTSSLLEDKDKFILFAQKNILYASIIYFIIYAAVTGLSLPLAMILTLIAGAAFGPIVGTIIVVFGATAGACMIFLIVKHSFAENSFLNKYKSKKAFKTIQHNIKKNEVSYLLFVRLVPIFPFALVNIAPATIGVKFKRFFWTTLVGITPGSLIYTYLGYQAGQIEDISDILSIKVLLALVILGLFSLIPVFLKNRKNAKNDKEV